MLYSQKRRVVSSKVAQIELQRLSEIVDTAPASSVGSIDFLKHICVPTCKLASSSRLKKIQTN